MRQTEKLKAGILKAGIEQGIEGSWGEYFYTAVLARKTT
jgi:hypothetical protein